MLKRLDDKVEIASALGFLISWNFLLIVGQWPEYLSIRLSRTTQSSSPEFKPYP
jgi:hypothetical protein